MVAAQTPTIAKIKRSLSLAECRALLSIAVCEVCDFFNVGKNMNNSQVAATVDLIIEEYGGLRLEEIKYCFRRAMKRERLFDRLDGNIILGWLRDYEAERDDAVTELRHNEEMKALEAAPSEDGMDFDTFAELTRRKAAEGDREAAETLRIIESMQTRSELSSIADGIRKLTARRHRK